MTTNDLSTYAMFVAVACVGIPAILLWVRDALRASEDKLTAHALRTERLMRRFILRPTQSNYSAVWDCIRENDVRLGSLDWETVRKFTLTSIQTNFTCNA